MDYIAGSVEDGTLAGPGLSAVETFVTFLVIPLAMFVIIAGLTWIASSPGKSKRESEFSVTTIN